MNTRHMRAKSNQHPNPLLENRAPLLWPRGTTLTP